MIAYAEYIAYTILAAILLWTLGDVASDWWTTRKAHRRWETDRRALRKSIEYWQKYDREFSASQKRIRGEE